MGDQKSGGIHIGNVGRDAKVQAGGDIVGHDKVTTQGPALADESQKQAFAQQVEELRGALREMKSQIESAQQLDQDSRDKLASDLLQQIAELKKAQEATKQAEPASPLPPGVVQGIKQCFDNAGALLEKVKEIGSGASNAAATIGPVLAKALPLLLSARHLVGLP